MMLSFVRSAVVDRVTDWWDADDGSVCVLAGSFGTGKSHILASLAERDTDWWSWLADGAAGLPLVFGSLRSREGERRLADPSIDGWLADLAVQLVDAVPEVTEAVIGSLGDQVGTSQHTNLADSKYAMFVVGSNADEWWHRFHRAVLAEAARVHPVLVVIDALDERNIAFRSWIVDQLASLSDGVRAVVSSRPTLELGTLRTRIVDLDGDDLDTERDLYDYCVARLGERDDLDEPTRVAFAKRIVASSERKFLYCSFICDEINDPKSPVTDPTAWTPPAGMRGLYEVFTTRLEEHIDALNNKHKHDDDLKVDWLNAKRILASVAVAQGDGITVSALALAHNISRASVNEILHAADHYLSSTSLGDRRKTRLWRVGHFSLAEYWLDTDDRDHRLAHVADAHQRLATGLLRTSSAFADSCTVTYIALHHCEARNRYDDLADLDILPAETVGELVTRWDWLEARIIHDGDTSGAITDLIDAVKACTDDPVTAAGECGYTPDGLLAALKLISAQLTDISPDQPQEIPQQLQHHAIRTDNGDADNAARARLGHHHKPCAMLSWSTQCPHPALQQVLTGQPSWVYSVAWSPDGRHLATAGEDNTVRIWDAASGTPTTTLTGHTGWVNSAAWSPDGRQLATASNDKTVRIWDTASGTEIATLTGLTDEVRSVVWSPNGRQLATASNDNTARIWDAASGTTTTTLTGHTDEVWSVSWSPDGHQLATAGNDKAVRIWAAASGTTTTTLSGHMDKVASVAWSPDGYRLATASYDNTVRVWDATSCTTTTTFTGHTSWVTSVAWSPDGHELATTSYDYTVRVWDAKSGTTTTTLTGHTIWVNSVAWSPDGRQLASASYDTTVRIWDAKSGTTTTTLTGHTDWATSVAWSPDGRYLATAGNDNKVCIWDATSGTTTTTLTEHTNSVWSVAWSPDGHQLATASYDKEIRIWDVASGTTTSTLTGHTDWVTSVAWSPDGWQLATTSSDYTARIWDVASGTTIITFTDHTNSVFSVAWSPDGHRLATASLDNTVRIWDPIGGRLTSTTALADIAWSVAWSDSRISVAHGNDVSVFELAYLDDSGGS